MKNTRVINGFPQQIPGLRVRGDLILPDIHSFAPQHPTERKLFLVFSGEKHTKAGDRGRLAQGPWNLPADQNQGRVRGRCTSHWGARCATLFLHH